MEWGIDTLNNIRINNFGKKNLPNQTFVRKVMLLRSFVSFLTNYCTLNFINEVIFRQGINKVGAKNDHREK